MNNEMVSVIIPIYNTQKYLKRCMDSVIEQTYQNIEIILIDDGSSDNSLEICKKYQENDKRVYIISGKNCGVSHARNLGIDKAKGKYLYFVDSDDYLANEAIEKMLIEYKMRNNQLVIAGYKEIENNLVKEKNWGKQEITNERAKELVLHENGVGGYLWNKLFVASLIKKNDIKFQEDISVWEDVLFVMQYLNQCDNVIIINDCIYAYCRREGSAVEHSLYNNKLYTQMTAMDRISKSVYLNNVAKEILKYRRIRCCLGLIRNMALRKNIEREKFENIENELKNIPKNVIKNLSITDKVSLALIKINPKLFISIYHYIHKKK